MSGCRIRTVRYKNSDLVVHVFPEQQKQQTSFEQWQQEDFGDVTTMVAFIKNQYGWFGAAFGKDEPTTIDAIKICKDIEKTLIYQPNYSEEEIEE